MKKIKILILVILCLVIQANAKQINLNVFSFADLVSRANKVNILINGDIVSNDYYFYTDEESPAPSVEIFRKMLELKGLKLLKGDGFYFVYNPYFENTKGDNYIGFEDFINGGNRIKFGSYLDNNQTAKLHYLRLKNNSFNEINEILGHYDMNATYIAKDNAVVFKSNDEIYSQILEFAEKFDDKKAEQVTFKITILETDLNNLRNLGSELNSLLKVVDKPDLSYFVNLISAPYSLNTNIIKSKKDKFYGVLNFLDEKKISSIKSAPFLTTKSNQITYFSVVENVPFLVSSSTYNNYGTSSQNSYEYRDIGLKLTIKPIIFKDYVDFDLNLVYDTLQDENTLTPITKKKVLKSNYTINKGEILVLSGINQETNLKYTSGVPLLKDIWLLKYLFSFETTKKINNVLTISIEVI